MSGAENTSKTQYITTAIVYPNSRIHVGWAWECLGADWLARSHRLFGRETYFLSGMDEHSINVQKAAEAKGLTPKSYCDGMAVDIERVLQEIGISYDRFIRTSDPDHERVVQALVKRAFDKGDIYKAIYEGLYCESCEAYYTEKDLVDGKCPQHGTVPKKISEENYFFKLSKYQAALLKLYKDHPEFIQPDYRRNEILNFVSQGLKDFSVSRSTFTWGVSLPWDPKHVVYVWFDALVNYITGAGVENFLKDPNSAETKATWDKIWPADHHIIGKDISRFHAVYWPAMLMSVELPLPKQIFVHGFMMIKGERMSKSTGNVVAPDEIVAQTGPDPFRYYVLAENQFSQDGNFSLDALLLKANADLANDWGNLVNRSISMTRKYYPEEGVSKPTKLTHSQAVIDSFTKLPAELEATIRAVDPSGYITAAVSRSRVLNLYIDQTKPWALAKVATPESLADLKEVLYTLLEGIRWIATLLLPVLPFKMPDVFRQLGIPAPNLQGAGERLHWGEISNYRPEAPSPLYPRIELPKPEVQP